MSWRDRFDAVERPVSAGAEAWVLSDAFMDALALAWKLQRRGIQPEALAHAPEALGVPVVTEHG